MLVGPSAAARGGLPACRGRRSTVSQHAIAIGCMHVKRIRPPSSTHDRDVLQNSADDHPASTVDRPGLRGWVRRSRRWWYPLVVVALLAQSAVAMITTALAQSPTIDEPVYVGAAVHYWQQGSLRYNPEHPPLGKLIIGTGLAFADPHLDPGFKGNQSELGRHVLYEAGNDADRLMLLARLPMILLTLELGLVVFAFARDLTGPTGALVALGLYAFAPNIIAHGSLATLDVATAGFLLTSTWLLWRARRRPWAYLPAAGLTLGAAVATKMSALAAVPVLLALAAWSVWRSRPPSPRLRRVCVAGGAAAAMVLVAVAVVWASYLVVDPRLQPPAPSTVPALGGLRGFLVDCSRFRRRSGTACGSSSSSRTGSGAGTCSARRMPAPVGTTCRPRCW